MIKRLSYKKTSYSWRYTEDKICIHDHSSSTCRISKLRHFDENFNMSKEMKSEEGNNTSTRNHKLKSKNSISMGSMHISGGMTTSASSTKLEQYCNNFEEDDGRGGIFF